jgi:hypothetical protein
MDRSLVIASIASLGVAFACGSTESSSSSGSSSGGSSSGASTSGGSSGGSSGGDTVGAEPFTPPAPAKVGSVTVFIHESTTSGNPTKLGIAAFFIDYSTSNGTAPDGYSRGSSRATNCTRRAVGACEVVKCRLTPDDAFGLAPPSYVSAGAVTVTRSSDDKDVPATADSQMIYSADVDTPTEVASGETVKIAASGGDVSAFSESIPFIGNVAMTSAEVLATNADTDVTWTGGRGPEKLVVVGESGGEEAGFVAKLTCTFDIAANKGTIPIAVLEDVRGNRFEMAVSGLATKKQIGDFDVDLLATSGSNDASSFALVVAE